MRKSNRKLFAVIDCETDPFEYGRIPKPFIWGYYDGKRFMTFRDTAKFVAFIRSKKITIYAHNGGKFDYMFLLDHVNPLEKILIINGRLSKLRIGACSLRDSYNLFPIALADYKKDKVDYSKFEVKVREKYMSEIVEYLKGDCVYLHELLSAYFDKNGMDVTQAAGSMKAFQKMRGEKMPRHNDAGMFAHFKQFYFGGRVECFRSGVIEENFKVVDINSAYPFAMTYNHPHSLDYEYGDREIPFSDTVRVFYKLSCVSRGAFPYREKRTSGINFPRDDEVRVYHVTDWEYWTAKNAGLISQVKIIECVKFADTINFLDYVNEFYFLRKQSIIDGDKAKSLMYKLRLNSLYGKFGSDYRAYENNIILPPDFEITGYEKISEFGDTNFLFSSPLPEADMKFYNAATAASITGFVRAFLLAAMVRVGFDNLFYCDTDSIATKNINGLNVGNELGAWKDEGDFVKAGIAGKKLYIFKKKNGKTKKACKGVRLTDAELWRVCRGHTVTHYKDAPSFSVSGKTHFQVRDIKSTIK